MDQPQPRPSNIAEQGVVPVERFTNIDYLHDNVHPFLKRLIELREKDPQIAAIYKKMEGYVVDPGMNRNRRFMVYDADNTQWRGRLSDRVAMLNRAGLVYAVMDKIARGEINPDDIVFEIHDIKEFRNADHAIDDSAERNSSADVIANEVGRAILAVLKKDELGGRYGGDEFIVAGISADTDGPSESRQRVESAVNQVQGYFNRNGERILENVQLKPGIKEIRPPANPLLKNLFWREVSHGLILDEQQLLAITDLMSPQELNELYSTELNLARLQEKTGSFTERKEAILTNYPEHAEMFAQLEAYEKANGLIEGELQAEAINYIREIAFDLLLGDYVPSFYHFQEDIAENQIESAICVDFKGIKERNDFKSIAHGDMAIKEMYNMIMQAIPEGERGNYRIYRRGSTIIVGVKRVAEGEKEKIRTSMQTINKIMEMQTISISGENIPLGNSAFILFPDYSEEGPTSMERRRSPGEIMGAMIDGAKNEWYKQIINLIDKNPDYLDPPEIVEDIVPRGTDPEPLHKGMVRELTLKETIQLFFWGKRADERCTDGIRLINRMIETANKPMYDRLKAIKDRFEGVKSVAALEQNETEQ